jgi:hypothetical protein
MALDMFGLTQLLEFTVFGIAILAVLWRYSALPDLDWHHIAMGVLFFLVGRSMEVWAAAFAGNPAMLSLGNIVSLWAVVFDIIAAAFVIGLPVGRATIRPDCGAARDDATGLRRRIRAGRWRNGR